MECARDIGRAGAAAAVAFAGVALGGLVLLPVLTQGFCWDETRAACASHQPSSGSLVVAGVFALALAVVAALAAAWIALGATTAGDLGWWRLIAAGLALLPLVPLSTACVLLMLGTPAADLVGHHATAVAVFVVVSVAYLVVWRHLIRILVALRRRDRIPT